MTNQTPVEYCRHENCGKPIVVCNAHGGCLAKGYRHTATDFHTCFENGTGQVAEPADPPQQQAANKLKLVLIEWVDSFGCSSHWQQISACSPTPLVCKSVGWLLYDGADCKVVVPHVSDSDHESSPMQGCGDMTIPTRAIVRIQQFPQLPFTELEWTAEEIKNFSEATAKPYAAPSPELIRLMSVKAGTHDPPQQQKCEDCGHEMGSHGAGGCLKGRCHCLKVAYSKEQQQYLEQNGFVEPDRKAGTQMEERKPMANETDCGQLERDALLLATLDPEIVFYGPHTCEKCEEMICRTSRTQGPEHLRGITFNYPQGPIYPNTNWVEHNCQADRIPELRTVSESANCLTQCKRHNKPFSYSTTQGYYCSECVAESLRLTAKRETVDSTTSDCRSCSEPNSFWVIERFESGKSAGYWDGANSRSFITDIEKAIHFCRKEDAFWATHRWHWADTQITEHIYLGYRPSVSESANREPQASPMKELCSMTQAASLDFAIDRVIQHLDVLDAFAVQSLRNKFKESERELQELRGLVGRICETVSEIGWCSICGRTDCGKNPLVHKPTCLISEAEAAIKEPHNG